MPGLLIIDVSISAALKLCLAGQFRKSVSQDPKAKNAGHIGLLKWEALAAWKQNKPLLLNTDQHSY